MIRILQCLILLTSLAYSATAQQIEDYHADLQSLTTVIRKLPSYHAQIKGPRLKEFNDLIDTLHSDTSLFSLDHVVFQRFARLFFLLKDNHLAFYQLPAVVLPLTQKNDTNAVRLYRNSSAFTQFPRVSLDLDSLEKRLQQLPADSVEGIYFYDNYLRVGVYQSAPGEHIGVVLSTTLPQWTTAQVAFRLFAKKSGGYHAIYVHPVFKTHILHNNERFVNHSLANSYFYSSVSQSVYKKKPGAKDYVNIPRNTVAFESKWLDSNLQYVRLGNFSNSRQDLTISQPFFSRIKDSLRADHLIVDIRNNTGGARAVSDKFLKIIKKYASSGKVYVLVNNGTMSRGEIFLLQLKGKKNIRTFGQTTNGTLSYGSNYGKTHKLPSGKMQVYITDMKDRHNHIRYEDRGVSPDFWLEDDGHWIDKVYHFIRANEK